VHDAAFMRRLQSLGYLPGQAYGLGEWQRPGTEPLRKRLAVDQFHYQEPLALRLFEAVQRRHVRVVERGEQARLPFKTFERLGPVQLRREDLQRDLAAKASIDPAIHLPHAAGAELAHDAVVP